MNRHWIYLLLISLLLSMTPISGFAVGGPGNPDTDPLPDPNDTACTNPEWPYYYYRHPVLFQETSHTGELRFVGFAYMDACKQSGKGERAGTASSLMELDGVWKPDILQLWSQLTVTALNEALPRIEHPGDNAFLWPVPAFPIHGLRYSDFYDASTAARCRYRDEDVDLVCPGIPREFGEIFLAGAGYARKLDRYGNYRWTPENDKLLVAAAWFKSAVSTRPPNPGENFYARHWADDMRNNHGDGGLIRVIMHPVDLTVHSLPETTLITDDGKAIIPLAIGNPSTRNLLKTTVGWRIAGETEWRPVDGWRGQGEEAWRPYAEPIPLAAEQGTYIEVLLSGAEAGQTIQLMANQQKATPEAGIYQNKDYDAYKNNIGQTKLEDGALDLAVISLTAPAQIACDYAASYQVRWVIRNSSTRTINARRQASKAPASADPANLRIGTRSFPPGDTVEEVTIPVGPCDDTVIYRVEINGDRALAETDYANNVLTRTTAIEAYKPKDFGFSGGEGGVIIVPADCERNTDSSSDYPCLNYPNLKMPR